MTEFEKLWHVVSNAPANTDFATLSKLMKAAGFELRMGSRQHAVFINRRFKRLQNVAKPHHGPVKSVYVRDCLKIIRDLSRSQENLDD